MKATFLKSDGQSDEREITKKLTLDEMRAAVGGGYVRPLYVQGRPGGRKDMLVMLVDEDGALKGQPFNAAASLVAGQPIVGDVVVLDHDIG